MNVGDVTDLLAGGEGSDTLNGGADTIHGGSGNDAISGGLGDIAPILPTLRLPAVPVCTRGKKEMPLSRLLAVLAVSIVTMAPQAADAALIYQIFDPHGVFGLPSLGTIDTITGASNVIGPTGFCQSTATAFDTNGTLYGIVDAIGAVDGSKLATFDLTTGVATVIGNTGIAGPALVLEIGADGTAYTIGWDETLYSLDKSSGLATEIGSTLLDSEVRMMDLAFDSLGALWATDMNMLWTISLSGVSAGEATFETIIQVPDVLNDNLYDYVMGIAFDRSNNLFATTYDPGILMLVNTTSGAVTVIDGDVHDLPLHGGDIRRVPEPGTLALLSTGLVGLYWARRRRRRA